MKEKLLFPTWRYHRTLPPRRLVTPEELAALGPDWLEYPPLPDGVAPAEPVTPPQPPPPEPVSEEEQAARRELHALTADQIIEKLDEITDLDVLARVRTREHANPKYQGGRFKVLKALDARERALGGR